MVPEAFAYRLPETIGDGEAAPLLCAGIVGYRALKRAELPPGGRLGIYGFGASAHVVAQVALAQGATVLRDVRVTSGHRGTHKRRQLRTMPRKPPECAAK